MKKTTISVLLLTSAVAISFANAATIRSLIFENPSYQDQHIAALPQLQRKAQSQADEASHLIENGMETNSCGFHIINPPFEVSALRPPNDLFPPTTNWTWWLVPPAYPEASLDVFGLELESITISTIRIFGNRVATLSKFQSPGGWGITATFSEGGMSALAQVHGPKASVEAYSDWMGKPHPNGGVAPEMEAALVTNGIALLPFSITNLVGLQGPQTATVAESLSEAEVDQIIFDYQNS